METIMKIQSLSATAVANTRTKKKVMFSIDKELWKRFYPIANRYRRKYSSIVEEHLTRYVQDKE